MGAIPRGHKQEAEVGAKHMEGSLIPHSIMAPCGSSGCAPAAVSTVPPSLVVQL